MSLSRVLDRPTPGLRVPAGLEGAERSLLLEPTPAGWRPELVGSGTMGGLIAERDWAATPLGPMARWPQSLRAVVDMMLAAPTPMIVLWGPNLVQVYNDGYAAIAGAKHPQALGQATRDCWPEVWEFNAPVYRAVRRGKAQSFRRQKLVIERHGAPEDAWFDLTYSALRDEAGVRQGVLVTVVEVTGQVRAEQELTASVERQRRLFQRAPGFTTILRGPEMVFEFVNDTYAQLFGDRDFVGRTVRDAFPDIAGQGFFELLQQVYWTGQRYIARDTRVLLRHSPDLDIEERFLDFVYEPIIDHAGVVTGLFVQGNDVTETHRARVALEALNADLERRVAERARELSRLWQVSPDLMGTFNQAGYFECPNPAWTKVLGWSADEVCRTPVFELIHPDDLDQSRAAFDRLKRGQPLLRFENRYRTKAGDWRWLSWVAVPEGDKFYCTARDVTADRERAAELEATEAQLRQAQKMEAVGQLTGGIAHDFNNTLIGIFGTLDLIQRRVVAKRYDDLLGLLDRARRSGERAASLTRRLLSFSRLQPVEVVSLDANAVVDEMTPLLRQTVGDGVRLNLALADDAWPVRADAGQLENALLNLTINARDAMPGGGALTIATVNVTWHEAGAGRPLSLAPGDYVAVSVGDTGTGMPQAVIERAFEPFFTTKPMGQGTGLGLSMIYGFANQSGGHLAVDSVVGRGTTITLTLPRAVADVTNNDAEVDTAAPPPPAGQTVMVVDDDDGVRSLVTDVLTELGHHCVEAIDGEVALPILGSNQRVDLLVTDIGLPGMSGRQLAKIARQLRPGLKVLFVTGQAHAELAGGEARPDATELIAKPFTLAALETVIAGLLAAAEATRPGGA